MHLIYIVHCTWICFLYAFHSLQNTDIAGWEKWLIHCKNCSEMYTKIRGSIINFYSINASLSRGNLEVSRISYDKETLYRIVGNSKQVMLYFRKTFASFFRVCIYILLPRIITLKCLNTPLKTLWLLNSTFHPF